MKTHAALLASLIATAATLACATEPGGGRGVAAQPKPDDDIVTGFTTCRACHHERYPIDANDNPFAKKFRSHEFVLLGEGRTWTEQDPHSTSFEALRQPLGKRMGRALGYDVTTAAQCLTCHAIDKSLGAPLPVKEAEVLARFDRSEGVTCNACHGLKKSWQREHFTEKDLPGGGRTIPWRTLLPEKKEEMGMRNLRDPVVKAQLCVSCHVGNAAEGKVVTHDMYAAGHPPLPPFELATFMEGQPRHWSYPTNPELKFFTQAGFAASAGADYAKAHPNWSWELYRFHPAEKEVYVARQMASGAVAALRAEARLLASDAEAVGRGDETGIDFARFDCFACHHELRYPSYRQTRGDAIGPPGRPPLKAWAGALPGVVIDHAGGLPGFAEVSAGFRPRWDALQRAVVAKPFGKLPDVARTAGDLAAWCDGFLKRQQTEAGPLYSPAESEKLLSAIADAAQLPRWSADPEAAMHLTWGYLSLRGHMKGDVAPEKLAGLAKAIPVQVRSGPYSTGTEPRPATEQSRRRLDFFQRYDPDAFGDAFRVTRGK